VITAGMRLLFGREVFSHGARSVCSRPVWAALLCALMLFGCGPAQPPRVVNLEGSPLWAADHVENVYLIAVGDELEVVFPYRPNLSQAVTVRPDGKISLPLIDPIFVVDMTPEQVQAMVVQKYDELAYDPTERAKDGEKQYLIGVSDVLEIKFHYQSDFNDQVTVRPDGKISLALVKEVVAEGKTPTALETELTKRYGKFIKKPELVVIVREFTTERVFVDGRPVRPGLKDVDHPSISVKNYNPRLVYVSGEVGIPGFVRFYWPMTALQAVAAAGGVKRSGKISNIVILRRAGVDKPQAIFVDLSGDVSGTAMNDVPLRPFDVVVVPKTGIAKLNDFLDQYLYDLIPATRNTAFMFIYDLNDTRARY